MMSRHPVSTWARPTSIIGYRVSVPTRYRLSYATLASLWLGNHSLIAPHFDFPSNIACCVAGRRRFLLFPPDQVANLYVGPWDLTPAGQAISLVDTRQPDLQRHPNFKIAMTHALTAELKPGDVIYLPSLWWHQVESLSSVNGLVNYWWTETSPVYGAPMDALTHALMAIKSLPGARNLPGRHYLTTMFSLKPRTIGTIGKRRVRTDLDPSMTAWRDVCAPSSLII